MGTFTSTHTFSSAGAMNIYINLMGIQPQDIVSSSWINQENNEKSNK